MQATLAGIKNSYEGNMRKGEIKSDFLIKSTQYKKRAQNALRFTY